MRAKVLLAWDGMGTRFVILLSLLVLGCPGFGDEEPPFLEVPELPEWRRDMKPLLDKYCNECHSDPATQGAPGYFRLDVCEPTNISGAKAIAGLSAFRTHQIKTMPTGNYPLQPSDTEREVFQQWFITGAPCMGPGELPNNKPNNMQNNSNNTTNNNSNNTNNSTVMPNNNSPVASFTTVATILATNCGTANCHGKAGGNGNLEIPVNATPEQVRTALAGRNVQSASAIYDANTPFVVPNNPEQSAIYLRVTSNTAGVRMPPAGNLVDAQLEAIRSWIAAGAPFQ